MNREVADTPRTGGQAAFASTRDEQQLAFADLAVRAVEPHADRAREHDDQHVAFRIPVRGDAFTGRPGEQGGVEISGLHSPERTCVARRAGEVDWGEGIGTHEYRQPMLGRT